MLPADRLWAFLGLPRTARKDKVYAVLAKLESNMKSSNWADWLVKAGDEKREALFRHSFAHTIVCRRVARDASIPGADMTWGDAENDGFIGLTGDRL